MSDTNPILTARQKIVSSLVSARLEAGMSQQELANRIGTKKPNISRIESGACSPTIDTLARIAAGLGKQLKIDFI